MSVIQTQSCLNTVVTKTARCVAPATAIAAEAYLDNPQAASVYCAARLWDSENLMRELRWHNGRRPGTVSAQIYDLEIVHELAPATLHATACWGELYFTKQDQDPIMVRSFHCFLAYVLKKYW